VSVSDRSLGKDMAYRSVRTSPTPTRRSVLCQRARTNGMIGTHLDDQDLHKELRVSSIRQCRCGSRDAD